jgi:FkbM family methyltransferase
MTSTTQQEPAGVAGATIHEVGPFQMWLLDEDTGISATLRAPDGYAQREPAFMSILRESARGCVLCVDIGANIGWATLEMAAASEPDGRVIAVEPVLRNVDALRANVALNGRGERVRVLRAAIGAVEEERTFHLGKASNLGGLDETANTGAGTERVPVLRLGSLLEEGERPGLYKMDVEGHEWAVLAGMRDVLATSPIGTRVLIEVHPELYRADADGENPMAHELRALVGLGYAFRYVVSAGVARPQAFADRGYEPVRIVRTFGFERGVYEGVDPEDAVHLSTSAIAEAVPGIELVSPRVVRSVTLERVSA